jgi:4-hydroxy-3-polyprenylbenzoate decarboxylase
MRPRVDIAMQKRRMVVAITGASGAIYGKRTLEVLKRVGVESHLIISRSGQITIAHELQMSPGELSSLADVVYRVDDIGAAVSSGSFRTEGMIIAPCSIRTASEIACGVTSSLVSRAADVVLKERRKLVLLVRETPLHLGHLRTMTQLCEMGAIVMPPVPAFYAKPETLDDMVDHTIARAMDLFNIDTGFAKRWGEDLDLRKPG